MANVYINYDSRNFYIVSLKQRSSNSEDINAVVSDCISYEIK
jgi:hypothetical protein